MRHTGGKGSPGPFFLSPMPSSDPSEASNNPVEQVLTRIASAALAEGLCDFLLVGGNAVILYGVPRFTRDVDFLIPAEDDLRWRSFLEGQGFRFIHGTPGFAQFEGPDSCCPRIDLMLVDRSTWDKLVAESTLHSIAEGLSLRLPVVHHLIAMKLRASRSATRANPEQDWSDCVELVRRHGYTLEEPGFHALVLKYGGPEGVQRLREKLAR